MKLKRAAIIAAASALLGAGIAGAVWFTVSPSYDEKVVACRAAVSEEWGETRNLTDNRPPACEDIKDDDYKVIVFHVAGEKSGVFDDLGID